MYRVHTLLVCCFGGRQQSTWTKYFKDDVVLTWTFTMLFFMPDLLISVPNFITLVKSYNLMQIFTYNYQMNKTHCDVFSRFPDLSSIFFRFLGFLFFLLPIRQFDALSNSLKPTSVLTLLSNINEDTAIFQTTLTIQMCTIIMLRIQSYVWVPWFY